MMIAVALAEAQRPQPVSVLFVQGKLRCPNDKRLRHLTKYKPYELKEAFQDQLNVVLRCPECGHIFSPMLEPEDLELLRQTVDDGD